MASNMASTTPLLRRMVPRDPAEDARTATPLELLYDLCFVVAIAQVAESLHHAIVHGHTIEGTIGFAIVFVAIWWAWMGFAWFASAFDTDDPLYRLKVLLQMVGVLVLAAGVPRAFDSRDFTFVTLGYAIMRVGLVAQWLRAARTHGPQRVSALRYAGGISVLQVGWFGLLAVPDDLWAYGWCLLVGLELLVPIWAQNSSDIRWHPHHIAERYGLMTIIVIGESVLASTLAVQAALDLGSMPAALIRVVVAAPIILFAMWWLYFSQPGHAVLDSTLGAFLWGYGHFFVFASAAAVGAALAVAADFAVGQAEISARETAFVLAVPVALFLVSVWFVQVRPQPTGSVCGTIFVGAAVAVLLAPLLPFPVIAVALVLALATALVVVSVARRATQRG